MGRRYKLFILNICTIKSIIELTSKTFERKAYELEEASDYWFPAEEFIPYKGLTVLIDKRRKHEI